VGFFSEHSVQTIHIIDASLYFLLTILIDSVINSVVYNNAYVVLSYDVLLCLLKSLTVDIKRGENRLLCYKVTTDLILLQ